MRVSFVIAVRDGAGTIAETLASLERQTVGDWEVVVVDDGSTDTTSSIVTEFAARDTRFRLLRTPTSLGVSAARNLGIANAEAEWLVFLDSDDWIAETYLERMTRPLRRDTTLDAVYCGWTFVTSDGFQVFGSQGDVTGDLFALHATSCPYAIHAYLVRKSLVAEVGAFDASLVVCEDWDLWQRFSRAGARFAPVPAVLAYYRIRGGSASTDGLQMLRDGLRVLDRGFSGDPRVPSPHPVHPEGLSRADWNSEKLFLLASTAGLVVGAGNDARPLISIVGDLPVRATRPGWIADCVAQGAMLSAARPLAEWSQAWDRCEPRAAEFLEALGTHLASPTLAARTLGACRERIARYRAPLGLFAKARSAVADIQLKRLHLREGLTRVAQDGVARIRTEVGSALRLAPQVDLPLRRWVAKRTKHEDAGFFEELFETGEDPWQYTNSYEEQKYRETLELLGDRRPQSALELACAEGHFTVQLASRVGALLATDISERALERAATRCAEHDHVSFRRLDFMNEELPDTYDLIVCSEVLYFANSVAALRKIAKRLVSALRPGGTLLMAHGKVVWEHPESVGFGWSHRFGATTIGTVFAEQPGLCFEEEIETDLYRVQRFVRVAVETKMPSAVSRQKRPLPAPLPDLVESQVLWSGMGDDLRVLTYHRVSETGPDELAPWCVSPRALAEQLSWLRDSGYRGVTMEEWIGWRDRGEPIPPNGVHLSFDDGYLDFYTNAWPILREFGFPVTVFLVSGEVGGVNRWDREFGAELPLMTWRQIRELQREGVVFGSHTVSHVDLNTTSLRAASRELNHSKWSLEQELGCPVDGLAYPYGESSARLHYLAARAGYRYGFTCAERRVELDDSLLALPRIEVGGGEDLATFAEKFRLDP